jgi:hypothetical protein
MSDDQQYRGSDDVAEETLQAAPPDEPLAEDTARGDGLATDAAMQPPPDDLGEDGPRGDGLADDA